MTAAAECGCFLGAEKKCRTDQADSFSAIVKRDRPAPYLGQREGGNARLPGKCAFLPRGGGWALPAPGAAQRAPAGSQSSVAGTDPSKMSSQRLISIPVPPLYPPSPVPATTRWQGTISGQGLEPMNCPTTRAGGTCPSPVSPARCASSP